MDIISRFDPPKAQKRKRFADGKVSVPFKRFLGYDRGNDGNLVVNEEQARIVRRIYGSFLLGMCPSTIARMLTREGIPTPGGKKEWSKSCIKSILTNEKYKGDALLQKFYTTDFLTKKKKKNEGEVPKYYIKKNHEAIIDPDTYDLVQTKMAEREAESKHWCSASAFSGRIRCGDCGSSFGPKLWNSSDKYRRTIWRCNHKYEGEKNSICATPHLTKDEIKELFLYAANTVITERDELISVYEEVLMPKLETDSLEADLQKAEEELNLANADIDSGILENALNPIDQAEYRKVLSSLEERKNNAVAHRDKLEAEIARRNARKREITLYFDHIRSLGVLTEFHIEDWLTMVDHMTVYTKDNIRITFKDGSEINAAAEKE